MAALYRHKSFVTINYRGYLLSFRRYFRPIRVITIAITNSPISYFILADLQKILLLLILAPFAFFSDIQFAFDFQCYRLV